jgi:hypothetical protein
MKNLSIVLLLAILASATFCTRKGTLEKEPNNSFSTANTVTLDALYAGSMDSPGDRDFYTLQITNRGVIDVQVSGVKGTNLAFKIWKGDEEPRLIKWVDDNRKSSPERMANISVNPGSYYLEIFQSDRDPRKSAKESPYEFTLKWREAVAEESEPNDSKDDADTLHADQEITGYYSPAYNRMNDDKENLNREEDWYVIDVALKSDASRLMDLSLSGVTGVNAIMRLYDSVGALLAESDNGGPDEPEMISGAGIKKSGSYYIMVASKGYTANHEEPYKLNATLKEHDSGAEIEPNGDFDRSNVISNNIMTGRINTKDDIDMFTYEISGEPAVLRIELRPSEDMDAILTIYSASREKIVDINAGGKGKKEIFPNFYTDKSFYLAVSAKTGEKLPAGEYILSVTPIENAEHQEREPNNDISQANRIKDKSIAGYTSFKGDKDFFVLTYDSRVKEKFEVNGVKGGAIKVSITDPLGYIIKSVDVKGDRKMIFSEMIDKKGYIIVESEIENYDNPYTIYLRGAQ